MCTVVVYILIFGMVHLLYNKSTLSGVHRLDVFTLDVGNTSNVNDYKLCASHNGSVSASESVEESCAAVARYLRFRRSGGRDTHTTGLCEVVVIGSRYTSK